MSFSGEVKEELLNHHVESKESAFAEIAAFLYFSSEEIQIANQQTIIQLNLENEQLQQRLLMLCKKNISVHTVMEEQTMLIPEAINFDMVDAEMESVLEDTASQRAFLRVAYLCIGSMSDPEKSYHMEFDCQWEKQANILQSVMAQYNIDAKIVVRKNYYVLYVKEGAAIVDLLNIMGAHVSLMNFENFRILKEMRNSVNRKVNCETANIAKTVSAATKQVQDIMLIEETIGLMELPQGLQDVARLRLEYQEASLQELGDYLEPPVGKSGVNHRLRKISEIAEKIRVQ